LRTWRQTIRRASWIPPTGGTASSFFPGRRHSARQCSAARWGGLQTTGALNDLCSSEYCKCTAMSLRRAAGGRTGAARLVAVVRMGWRGRLHVAVPTLRLRRTPRRTPPRPTLRDTLHPTLHPPPLPTLRPPPRLIHRPMRHRTLRLTPRPMVVWTITVGVATAAATTAATIEEIAGVLTVAIAVAMEADHAAVRQTGPKSKTDQGLRCVIVYWTGRWMGCLQRREGTFPIAAHRRTGRRWARGPIFDRAIHGQSTICATTNGRAV